MKKLFSVLLSFILVMAFMPTVAFAAEPYKVEASTIGDLQTAAISDFIAKAVDITLKNDITLDSSIYNMQTGGGNDLLKKHFRGLLNLKSAGHTYTLDLNGHVLNGGDITDPTITGKPVIQLGDVAGDTSVKLIIKDSNPNAIHKFSVDANGQWHLDPNGTKIVKGGIITGGGNTILFNTKNATSTSIPANNKNEVILQGGSLVGGLGVYGGAVLNQNEFTMNGGKIIGCRVCHIPQDLVSGVPTNADGNGGGVYNMGTFTMNGGEISDCVSHCGGGGVFNEYATGVFNFNAGTIANCKANGTENSSGGGLYNNVGKVIINGGNIKSCTATQKGGAVYNSGDFTMQNGEINSCSADLAGGAVYNVKNSIMSSIPTRFIMENGTISSCKSKFGGAIVNEGDASERCYVSIKGNSKLTSNTADDTAGAIYNLGEVKINGNATFTGNKAAGFGGAVYNGENAIVNILSGNISSNTAARGSAVYHEGSELNLSNKPNVADVFYLAEDKLITIKNALTNTTPYKVELKNGVGVFTSDWEPKMGTEVLPSKHFRANGTNVPNMIKTEDTKEGALAWKVSINDSETTTTSYILEKDGKVTQPSPDPTLDGYTFGGWYTSRKFNEEYDFNEIVTKDITIYAKMTDANGKIKGMISESTRSNGNPVPIRNVNTKGEGIHGTYKVDKPFVTNGETVKIIATPDEGYEIDKIYVDGKEVKSLEIKNVTEDTKVEVTFKKIDEKKDEQKEEQQKEFQKVQKQVSKAQFIARSNVTKLKNGKSAIKVTWHDGKNVGVKFDGYEVYRSTDRQKGYGNKPIFKTKNKYYYNTKIEAGQKYYYKVRAYKVVDGKKVYTDYSLKAWREI